MRLVTVKFPQKLLKEVDARIEKGYYYSRSDLIRHAVRSLLEQEAKATGVIVEVMK